MEKGEKGGKLIFFDKDTFKKSFELVIEDAHVIRYLIYPIVIRQLLTLFHQGSLAPQT